MADKIVKDQSKDIQAIENEYDFERKEIRIHRIFWGLVVAFLTAGLLGYSAMEF